jgi:hypothetical protein
MKCFLKWTGIVCGALFLLYVALVLIPPLGDKAKGEKLLSDMRRELDAKREKLILSELAGAKPVPEEENFYGDPIWRDAWDRLGKNPEFKDDSASWQILAWDSPLSTEEQARYKSLVGSDKAADVRRHQAIWELQGSISSQKETHRVEKAALLIDIAKPADPVLQKLSELVRRPAAYLPIRYQDGFSTVYPQMMPILRLGTLLGGKASAELVLNKAESAQKDIETAFGISGVLKDPVLIILLVKISVVTTGVLKPVNQGIELHAWDADQLARFQKQLGSLNLINELQGALRGERACLDQTNLTEIFKLTGIVESQPLTLKWMQWFYEDYQKVYYDHWIERYIALCDRARKDGINATTIPEEISQSKSPTFSSSAERRRFTEKIAALLAQGGIRSSMEKALVTQTQVDQTLIACALERYRLDHGSYPSSLDDLVPEYLAKLPNSPINGKPLNYSLKSEGTFLLWSPGWELKSLGGKPGEYFGEGDIVWGQPLPKTRRPKPENNTGS